GAISHSRGHSHKKVDDRFACAGVAHDASDRPSRVHLDRRRRTEKLDSLVTFGSILSGWVEIAEGPARSRICVTDCLGEVDHIVAGEDADRGGTDAWAGYPQPDRPVMAHARELKPALPIGRNGRDHPPDRRIQRSEPLVRVTLLVAHEIRVTGLNCL